MLPVWLSSVEFLLKEIRLKIIIGSRHTVPKQDYQGSYSVGLRPYKILFNL